MDAEARKVSLGKYFKLSYKSRSGAPPVQIVAQPINYLTFLNKGINQNTRNGY